MPPSRHWRGVADQDISKSIAAKAWLAHPQTQAEFSKELADKTAALKEYENILNALIKVVKAEFDVEGDLRIKMRNIRTANLEMTTILETFKVKTHTLADDIENLQRLGITAG